MQNSQSISELMKILKGDEYPDKSPEWVDGFDAGVSAVLAIRCITHRAVPTLNDEAVGAECPICETARLTRALDCAYQALNTQRLQVSDEPFQPTGGVIPGES